MNKKAKQKIRRLAYKVADRTGDRPAWLLYMINRPEKSGQWAERP